MVPMCGVDHMITYVDHMIMWCRSHDHIAYKEHKMHVHTCMYMHEVKRIKRRDRVGQEGRSGGCGMRVWLS